MGNPGGSAPRIDDHRLRAAVSLHQAGRFAEAEAIYEELLDSFPDHAGTVHMYGVLAYQTNRVDLAIEFISRAIRLNPSHAACYCNLGNAYKSGLRLQEAIASYRQALAINPELIDAHLNLGAVLCEVGEFDDALTSFQQVIRIAPMHADAHFNVGQLLENRHEPVEAIESYRRAVEARPDHSQAHYNLATLLRQQGRTAEAIENYRQALESQPDHADALNNLGNLYTDDGRLSEAIACFRRSLNARPTFAAAYNNLANALTEADQLEEAVAHYRLALKHRPDYVDAYTNLGRSLVLQGRGEEALSYYREAARLQPDCTEALWGEAHILLQSGDFAAGWRLYESRWKLPVTLLSTPPDPSIPAWLGDVPVKGKTILLRHEQGYGDTLQMLRFVPVLTALGATVVVEVPRPLASVTGTVPGVAEVVTAGAGGPPVDLQCHVMSLPLALSIRLGDIPAEVPYLAAPPSAVGFWQERLGTANRPRIGLTWAGAKKHKNDRRRSLELEALRPLLALDADFYSLQVDYRPGDTELMGAIKRIRDCSADLTDFGRTAGLIANLDLVVSVDTAVAHLAGALGAPVWVLLPVAADFRWLHNRRDSPWYPTMRLFRQSATGDWEAVVRSVLAELSHVDGTAGWFEGPQ